MKQCLKLIFSLAALQISVLETLSTFDSPGPVYYYLCNQSMEIKSQEALLYASSHSELFQYTLEFFESHQGVEKLDSQTLENLRNDLAHFNQSIEKLKSDPDNCQLQRDVSNQISELRSRTRDHLYEDAEQIAHWRSQDRLDQNSVVEHSKKIIATVKEELPNVVEKYKQGLGENERKDFENIVTQKANLFAGLHAMYKAKMEAAAPTVIQSGDAYCNNYEISLVLALLQKLS
uniref:Uncharacterized protein n=1 Tax=Stomoxys calcitrans TaxID=35570 RepID=A0A1I8PUJ7_STOCA